MRKDTKAGQRMGSFYFNISKHEYLTTNQVVGWGQGRVGEERAGGGGGGKLLYSGCLITKHTKLYHNPEIPNLKHEILRNVQGLHWIS